MPQTAAATPAGLTAKSGSDAGERPGSAELGNQRPPGAGAQPKDERGFRPDIQGMRALAVGMVVIYHLYPKLLPGGFAGVDVFFVISGFLITGHLLREYRKNGKISLVGFWGRRAKRLMPAAALVLTVTWLVSRLVLPATQLAETATQIRASALYYQNWQLAWNAVDYLKADAAATPVQHFWSLSVEEQFYLGWPLLFLLAALAARTAGRRRAKHAEDAEQARRSHGHLVMFLLAAAVVAGSLWYSVYDTRVNPAGAYFVTTTRIWELGLGGLLALLPARASKGLGRVGLLGWAGLGLVVASAFVLNGTQAFPGILALLPAGGAALLILSGSAAGRLGPHRLTSTRTLVFIGGISYSLYLWHWPVIVLYAAWRGHAPGVLSGAAIIVVSVALSWLTKVWVEDKVRTASLLSGHDWRSVSTAFAAVVPVALATVFLVTQPGPWNGHLGSNYPGAAALAGTATNVPAEPILPPPDHIPLSLYRTAGCLVDITLSTPHECVFGDTTNPVLTVALVGDSAAGEWFDALDAIAVQRHWKLVTELHSSCPWSAAVMLNSNDIGTFTACHTWGAAVLHDLVTTIRPDVVLTSDYPAMATVDHPGIESPAAMAEIGAGMAKYWTQLTDAGISVTAIKESPDLVEDVPTCVEKYPTDLAKCDVPTSKAILQNSPVSLAAKLTGGKVSVVDANNLVCGPQVCVPVVGNILVFSDRHHLTPSYSKSTAPYLEQELLKASKILSKT
jgi:peptidoglycan/LPS O-acetylase OafA/YrhL